MPYFNNHTNIKSNGKHQHERKKQVNEKLEIKNDYNQDLRDLLARPNIAAKDWVIREYDHEVQAGSVLKSVPGIERVAVNDASVVRPDLDSNKWVATTNGIFRFNNTEWTITIVNIGVG